MIAIENGSGSHHVRPGFRPRYDRGAVRQVHNPRIDPQRAQALECGVESLLLFACLLPNVAFRENSRGSKVRKDARELDVFAFSELPRKTLHVPGGDTQPVHAGIDLQMKPYALLSAAARRRAIHQLQFFPAMDPPPQPFLPPPLSPSRP